MVNARKAKSRSPALTTPPIAWWQRTWFLALLSSLLLWASFPPFDLWPLAWFAPVPWLLLIRQPQLMGWKPYLQIWLAGFVHWLLMLQGVRLAHPALYGGWLALSAYLAVYLVLFISISRVAVHQLRWPLYLVAPVVWVGLELLRGHLISGFSCGLLSHTQTEWTLILQIADLGGAYAVSFVMLAFSAMIAHHAPQRWFLAGSDAGEADRPALVLERGPLPKLFTVSLLVLSLGYGWYRLQELPPDGNRTPLRVALIQGSLDTRFDQPYEERVHTTFSHYGPLTNQAAANNPALDLIVWPESMFAIAELTPCESDPPQPADKNSELRFAEASKSFRNTLTEALAATKGASFLFGTTTLEVDLASSQGRIANNYNAALLAGPDNRITGRYYKMHAVMFGEYIPCGDLFPFLYGVTPMGAGLTTGKHPVAMQVHGYTLAPNICFESTVPHLIREQVHELERQTSQPVDVIVNVTNDGWFWGSSILDLHFRCSVFRAIENRKPVIIAANTGIAAHIDGNGRVLQRGPKRAPQVLIANVIADGRSSPTHLWGDLPAWLCAWMTWALAVYGTWRR